MSQDKLRGQGQGPLAFRLLKICLFLVSSRGMVFFFVGAAGFGWQEHSPNSGAFPKYGTPPPTEESTKIQSEDCATCFRRRGRRGGFIVGDHCNKENLKALDKEVCSIAYRSCGIGVQCHDTIDKDCHETEGEEDTFDHRGRALHPNGNAKEQFSKRYRPSTTRVGISAIK